MSGQVDHGVHFDNTQFCALLTIHVREEIGLNSAKQFYKLDQDLIFLNQDKKVNIIK